MQTMLIFLLIFVFNSGINVTVNLLKGEPLEALTIFISGVSTYTILYGMIYLFVYAIIGVTTHYPYILSLNGPRKLAPRVLQTGIIARAVVFPVVAISFLYLSTLLDPGSHMIKIFGVYSLYGSITKLLMVGATMILSFLFIGNLGQFFGNVGMLFGSKITVALSLFLAGIGLVTMPTLIAWFFIGAYMIPMMILLALLNTVLLLVNYKLTVSIEVKA